MINQLSAVCSAVNHAVGVIVSENLTTCLKEPSGKNTKELVKEAVKLIGRSR